MRRTYEATDRRNGMTVAELADVIRFHHPAATLKPKVGFRGQLLGLTVEDPAPGPDGAHGDPPAPYPSTENEPPQEWLPGPAGKAEGERHGHYVTRFGRPHFEPEPGARTIYPDGTRVGLYVVEGGRWQYRATP